MTNPLAVTTVTAAFSHLLQKGLDDGAISGVTISNQPPEFNLNGPRLNLFLYQIDTNASLRNGDAPFRDEAGQLVRRPVLPLNLHYLLTAFGSGSAAIGGDQLEAQYLLAQAMSYVNDNAVLTRSHVRDAITSYANKYAPLRDANLDGQIELVKLTPLQLSPENISKLWTAFAQRYRISVAYEASVVLIERQRPTKVTPPVRSAQVYTVPIDRPIVDTIAPTAASVGDRVTITGRNLSSANDVRVRFGGVDVVPNQQGDEVRPTRVSVTVPGSAQPGLVPVQVVHQLRIGAPVTPGQPPPLHRGFESNTVALMIVPTTNLPVPPAAARSVGRFNPTQNMPYQPLRVVVTPPVHGTQAVTLLLTPTGAGGVIQLGGRVAAGPDPSPTLEFVIPQSCPTGTYLAQVRIDGAESRLNVPAGSTTPNGPRIQVT